MSIQGDSDIAAYEALDDLRNRFYNDEASIEVYVLFAEVLATCIQALHSP